MLSAKGDKVALNQIPCLWALKLRSQIRWVDATATAGLHRFHQQG